MSRTEINRDRYGRPLVPDPATGAIRPWTRVTTLAGTIDDRYGLEQWGKRNIVKGFASREDLLVRAVAAGDDRKALQTVVESAEEAAKAHAAADVGTALHTITERIDRGESVDLPASLRPDVEAYRSAIERAELAVADDWIERFVVVPDVGAAGTMDRLYAPANIELPMIGDIKTGQNVIQYGQVKIAAQLAIYSRASHWFDGAELHPMPKVDQDWGIVAHMPAGVGECTLYRVNLNRGWEVAKFCLEARKWRKADGLLEPILSHEVSVNGGDPERESMLRDRLRDVVTALEGAALPIPWPSHINPPKRQTTPYSVQELELIDRWCDQVAAVTDAPPF